MNRIRSAKIRNSIKIPLSYDDFCVDAELVTFYGLIDDAEHLAVCLGNPSSSQRPLVRLHSECLTGDVFSSARCDCGPQLREAIDLITQRGGYLLYLRQEGRGIGLYNKLDAYTLQNGGMDTYAANTALGLPEDDRDYTAAAQMLAALNVKELDLLSNSPDKAAQLRALGVEVCERIPTGVHATKHNLRYLRAKVERMQHTIELAQFAIDQPLPARHTGSQCP
ncbi:GTP cyclohydrolase II [Streptomyces sp. NPDC055085]